MEGGKGVNGRGRTGKAKAASTRHMASRKDWAMFNTNNYLFTLVPVLSRETVAVSSVTSSSLRGVCRQSLSPQSEADTQPVNFPSRRGTSEKSCCSQKRGTTSAVVKSKRCARVENKNLWTGKERYSLLTAGTSLVLG